MFTLSPRRGAWHLLAAFGLSNAPMLYGGQLADRPASIGRSAVRAVGDIFQAVPPSWQAPIGNYLDSRTMRPRELRAAFAGLVNPTQYRIERARRLDSRLSFPHPPLEELLTNFVVSAENLKTPGRVLAAAKKLAALNMALSPYLADAERASLIRTIQRANEFLSRKNRRKLNASMLSVARALQSPVLEEGAAVNLPRSFPSRGEGSLPKGWQLGPSLGSVVAELRSGRRDAVLEAIRILEESGPPARSAVADLGAVVWHSHDLESQRSAIGALGAIGGAEAVAVLKDVALRSKSHSAAINAAEALEKIAGDDAVEALGEIARRSPNHAARMTAAKALAKFDRMTP